MTDDSEPTPPQRCPVDYTLKMIGGKWKPLILHRLHGGTLRFGQLQRLVPQVTQRVLTLQLRELERDGLITRKVYPEVPPRVEYDMTEPARALMPILDALGNWLHQNDAKLETLQHEAPSADEPDEAATS